MNPYYNNITFRMQQPTFLENYYYTMLNPSKDEVCAQPNYIKTPLKTHQLMTLKKALDIEKGILNMDEEDYPSALVGDGIPFRTIDDIKVSTKMGAICDPVGSGKTLTILSLAAKDLEHKEKESMSIVSKIMSVTATFTNDIERYWNCSVIVVPHTIFVQWRNNIKEHTNLTVYCFDKKGRSSEWFDREISKIEEDTGSKPSIILVKSSAYSDFHNVAYKIQFKRVFYDEADSIHLPGCPELLADFYWMVTANDKNITHRYVSVKNNGFIKHSLLELTKTRVWKYCVIRNDEQFIHNSFNLADYNRTVIKCKNNKILNILSNHVSDTVQAMICAGDIESAIATFNLNSSSEDNIISVVCESMLMELENLKAKLEYIKNKKYSSEEVKQEAIDRTTEKIDRVSNSIQNIKERISEEELDPISFCEIENPVITKCCKTRFDFETITMYILSKSNPMCPICRTPIKKENLVMISNRPKIEEEEEKESDWNFEENSKIDNIEYLINRTDNNARIIVFSAYDNSVKLLTSKGYKLKEVKGTAASINNIVKWFQSKDEDCRKILFMNAKYAGAGLNLQACSDIFIYHKLNESLTNQVIGRAHRPGREGVLNVYEFEE